MASTARIRAPEVLASPPSPGGARIAPDFDLIRFAGRSGGRGLNRQHRIRLGMLHSKWPWQWQWQWQWQ